MGAKHKTAVDFLLLELDFVVLGLEDLRPSFHQITLGPSCEMLWVIFLSEGWMVEMNILWGFN